MQYSILAILATVMTVGQAMAFEQRVLATPAYYDFCKSSPSECSVDLSEPEYIDLTDDTWGLIVSVNTSVNRAKAPTWKPTGKPNRHFVVLEECTARDYAEKVVEDTVEQLRAAAGELTFAADRDPTLEGVNAGFHVGFVQRPTQYNPKYRAWCQIPLVGGLQDFDDEAEARAFMHERYDAFKAIFQ